MSASECPRCGEPNEAGALQCSNPRCRSFLPGNAMARRGSAPLHGATKGETLEAATSERLAEIEETLAGTPGSEPRYARQRWLAALALARLELLMPYFDANGWQDAHGRPRPAVKLFEVAFGAAMQALAALGMSPVSAGRLGLDLGRTRALTLAEKIAAERRA